MPKDINKVQELNLQLMEQVSRNGLNGKQITSDLRDNKHLWEAAVLDMDDYHNLIKLRDLSKNYWNVDSLFIIVEKGKEVELENLAENWDADEIYWLSDNKVKSILGTKDGNHMCILKVWWD